MAVSERPWSNYTAADYESPAAYCDACLINLNTGTRSDWTKGNCKLPVEEPNGDLNRAAVHSAAAVLAGGRGGVDAPPDAKRSAARRLDRLYGQLKEGVPDSITRMAG